MNSSYFNPLNILHESNPPRSRLSAVISDLLLLIPNESYHAAEQILLKHSKVPSNAYLQACFLSIHVFLTFTDRLACMHTNKEWRCAILQPVCWRTVFGVEESVTMYHETLFFIPLCSSFVQQMSKTWSRVKSVSFRLDYHASVKRMLDWLDHEDSVSLKIESLKCHQLTPISFCVESTRLITIFCHRFVLSLRILDMSSVIWEIYFAAGSSLQLLHWPVLECLTAYDPFKRCFIQAPKLKRLLLKSSRDVFHLDSTFSSRQPHILYPECTEIECYACEPGKSNFILPNSVLVLKINLELCSALSMFDSTRFDSNHVPLDLIMCQYSFAHNWNQYNQQNKDNFVDWNITSVSWTMSYFFNFYRTKLQTHYHELNDLFSWSITKKFPVIRIIEMNGPRMHDPYLQQDINDSIVFLKEQGHQVEVLN
jgi:hypothetical protein